MGMFWRKKVCYKKEKDPNSSVLECFDWLIRRNPVF
jgi:hypothetical protein